VSDGPPSSAQSARPPRDLLRAIGGSSPQLVRYAIAGAIVGLTYVALTLALSGPAGWPIQLAIPVAYALAVALHFALQRLFVFRDREAFVLATHRQVGRYLVLCLVQYALTAASTAVLPGLLGLPESVVYVGTVAVVSAGAFVVLRTSVFHAPPA